MFPNSYSIPDIIFAYFIYCDVSVIANKKGHREFFRVGCINATVLYQATYHIVHDVYYNQFFPMGSL